MTGVKPHRLAQDGSYVYWTNVSSGDIRDCPIDTNCLSGNTLTISGAVQPQAIAVGGTGNLYWSEGTDGGTVWTCLDPSAIGCMPAVLAQTQSIPGEMVADANDVYVTFPQGGSVLGIDISTSVVTVVASSQHEPTFVALDASYVYWVDLDGLKRCRRSPGSCGGSPTLLTPLPLEPGGIAVSSGVVYGALRAFDLSGNAVAAGAVYRFPAPP
jgi:hypothetical protein